MGLLVIIRAAGLYEMQKKHMPPLDINFIHVFILFYYAKSSTIT